MSRMRTPPVGWAMTDATPSHRAAIHRAQSFHCRLAGESVGEVDIAYIGLTLSHTFPNQPRFWLSLTDPVPSKRKVRSANWWLRTVLSWVTSTRRTVPRSTMVWPSPENEVERLPSMSRFPLGSASTTRTVKRELMESEFWT